MAAANLDILIEQGATFARTLTFKDPTGALIDLTGWTFTGQIRAVQEATVVLGEFVFSVLNQVTNKGQATWSLSAANTFLLPVPTSATYRRINANYIYDVNATKADATVERVLQGKCVVSPEVTRE